MSPVGSLSREDALLLACASIELPPETREQVADLLHGPLDWDHILARAVRHGIATLVYRHLRELAAGASIPEHVWRALERAYRIAQLLTMRQRFQVGRMLEV